VEVRTSGLSGTELGVDYAGAVTVLSNRGQQTVSLQVRVVDEPLAHLEPAQLDLGKIGWGKKGQERVTVSNRGGGTLHGRLVGSEPWLLVDPAVRSFALGKGQSLPVTFTADTTHFARRGRHSGRLQVQAQGRGNPVTAVTLEVDVPYLLDPARPATAVSTAADLIAACDGSWEGGLRFLQAGRLEAFLRFVGEDALAQAAAEARQQPDPNVGLETLLRACGALPPAQWDHNAADVEGDLGYGFLPKLGKKPDIVTFRILNRSQRGYLHGYLEPVAPWLSIPQPRFGCLPGQMAEVEIHADHKARRGKFFSLGEQLFDIVIE
jgi:hypothetical protein